MFRSFDAPDVRARCPFCAEFVEAASCDEIEPCSHLSFAYLTACSEFAYIAPHAEEDVQRAIENNDLGSNSMAGSASLGDLTSIETELVVGLEGGGRWRFLRMADQYSAVFFGFQER